MGKRIVIPQDDGLMDFWIGGLLVLSSEKAKMHEIEWKYIKGILKILDALFSAYFLDLQQSSNPSIQQSMKR